MPIKYSSYLFQDGVILYCAICIITNINLIKAKEIGWKDHTQSVWSFLF